MDFINNLSRFQKIFIVIVIDILASLLATWISFSIRLDTFHIPNDFSIVIYFITTVLYLPFFIYFGLYNSIFRFVGFQTLIILLKSTLLYALTFTILIIFIHLGSYDIFNFQFYGIPRSLGIIQPLIFLFFITIIRISGALILQSNVQKYNKKKFIIYGAGVAGVKFESSNYELDIVCFLDDNGSKVGKEINGKKIYSSDEIEKIINKELITDILVAIPSLGFNQKRYLVEKFNHLKINVRFLPSLGDIVSGNINETDFRPIQIEDLIERKINFKNEDQDFFYKKKVFISGAGGSIGQEICLQLMSMNFDTLILFDNSEYNLYQISSKLDKLSSKKKDKKIFTRLGSIRDSRRLEDIFSEFSPDIIYHCAAYKHVPIIEHNIVESITNNIFGTKNIVDASIKYKVNNFVLISTDKAVRPTNVMGASKRIAELYVQAQDKNDNNTTFSIVRFGNVLYSSGSVAPLFTDQITKGGPVTVTHQEVTRYFMTIPEAARLVIQSSILSKGGEVYVLDMGEPIKLIDMAKKMIQLSGLSVKDDNNPSGDIEIKIIGLRPGEKLYEELLISADAEKTDKEYIFKAHEKSIESNLLDKYFAELQIDINKNNNEKILKLLKKIVPEFNHLN